MWNALMRRPISSAGCAGSVFLYALRSMPRHLSQRIAIRAASSSWRAATADRFAANTNRSEDTLKFLRPHHKARRREGQVYIRSNAWLGEVTAPARRIPALPSLGEREPLLRRAPVTPPVLSTINPTRWGPILHRLPTKSARVHAGNAVKFLIDGHDAFREMVASIRSATSRSHYVYILGWVLYDDFELIRGDRSSTMRQLLSAAAGRDV